MGFFTDFFGFDKATEEVKVEAPRDAKAYAAQMPREEVSTLIRKFGKGVHPFTLEDGIYGEIKDLVVQWVIVHKIEYPSIPEALKDQTWLDKDTRWELELIHEDYLYLRKQMLNMPRFEKVSTLFDGDVYLYQEGSLPLGTNMKAELITTDAGMMVSDVYLEGEKGAADYRFNFTKLEEVESFNSLIGNNPAYVEQMASLKEVMSRLMHYNVLFNEGRLSVNEGKVTIAPPTQIKGGN